MQKIIKKYITVCTVLLFIATLNVEAGKLKKTESNFSKVEVSAQEVSQKLDLIKQYIEEIDKPGSFLKKTFEGIDHAWYAGTNWTTISNRYPLNKRNYERNIRNVRLKSSKRTESWKLSIKIYFNAFYKDFGKGKLLLEKESGKSRKNWFKNIEKKFIKKGIEKKYISEAVNEYNEKYAKQINNLLSLYIHNKIDNLYENVYFSDLGGKKLRHKFYTDDKAGRKNIILNDLSIHNEIIKKNRQILLAGTIHNAAAGSVPRNDYYKNLDFQTYLCSRRGERKGDINLGFELHQQMFKLMGEADNEIYSKQNDFIGILDEYVSKGLAVKSKDGDVVKYEDKTSQGKYKGSIIYHLKKHKGYWIPPMWNSKDDLKKIKSAYLQAHNNFLTLTLQYLDSGFNEIVRNYMKIQVKKAHSNEF